MKNIQDLSLQEKLGQILFIGFNGTTLTEELKSLIREYKFGNFILFSRNCKNIQQIEKLVHDIYEEVLNSIGIIPFIGIDQEGGNVVRIMDKSTYYPGFMTLSAANKENSIDFRAIGKMIGKDLITLGINMNLSPCLDINSNPKNPKIGTRSFSDKPEIVCKYGIEIMKGMQEEGIFATAKHFPGHGDVEIDPHFGLPLLPFDRERLNNVELKPFKEAIENGIKNIMTAHIIFKEVDKDNPSTISKKILDILRNDLNYKGLITSDCMEMDAISKGITTSEGAIKGLKAGNDLILVGHTEEKQKETLENIKKSIEDNKISIKEIDDKVERILKYKNELYPIIKEKYFNSKNNIERIINSNQDKIIQEIVDSSLTLVNGKKLELKGKTLIYWCEIFDLYVSTNGMKGEKINDILIREIPSINLLEYKPGEYSKDLVDKSKNYDTIIFLSFNAFSKPNQVKMINELNKINPNFYVISMRNPYDYLVIDQNINFYTLYESTPNALRTLIKFLKGEIDAKGKLPINLKNI